MWQRRRINRASDRPPASLLKAYFHSIRHISRRQGLEGEGKPTRKAKKADPKVDAALETPVGPLRDKKKPNFGREYNDWYSAALPTVRLLLPDRIDEFLTLY